MFMSHLNVQRRINSTSMFWEFSSWKVTFLLLPSFKRIFGARRIISIRESSIFLPNNVDVDLYNNESVCARVGCVCFCFSCVLV